MHNPPTERLIHTVFVPSGREYENVRQGLQHGRGYTPVLSPIPVGMEAVRCHFRTWHLPQNLPQIPPDQPIRVLLMGLCGSLSPDYQVGEVVLYDSCIDGSGMECVPPQSDASRLFCDRTLTDDIAQHLNLKPVTALTSDRLIFSAQEKQALAQQFPAAVVDMEGFAVLEALQPKGIAVAMIRVVSDDCFHDLPDLTAAFSPDGSLLPLPLALGMLRQPLAAARLIQGSLKGLQVLQEVTRQLFSDPGLNSHAKE